MEHLTIPKDYEAPLTIRETEVAIKEIKDHFERALAKSLHLTRVSAPLFVKPESGLNDNLNGVERPVSFGIKEQNDNPVEIVHSLAKWKRKALAEYDLDAEIFTFEAGEAYKTRETKEQLEDQLLKNGYGRDTAILALGGGVVGDVAGYVAATYMRGVPVVQIPTTTLSMADSSIGGKTGVDTPYGKNLIGAFHHPVEVYMDMETLTTLDERNYIAGMAELLKHGFIHDVTILDYVDQHREGIALRDPMVLEEIFRKNCAVKNYVVSMDEQEKGLRQILNYGHTLGHAVEIRSGFKLIHGECVSIGMVFAAELARMKGLCSAEWADLQRSILKKIGLPVDLPAAPEADQLIELMKMDKKVRQGKTLFVLSEEPGRA